MDQISTTSPSHLFYLSNLRRPVVDRAEGIYVWTEDGRRFIDGSSGPVAVNLGYGNPVVLEAMRRQMERTTFAYRLHFENEPAEQLATTLAERLPGGLDRIYFVSGGSEAVESCIKLARQWAVATGQNEPLEGDWAHAVLSWRHLRLAGGHRRRLADGHFRRPDADDADHTGADRLSRPRQSLDGTARRPLCRHAGGKDPLRGAGIGAGLHHGADRRRGDRRAGGARQLLPAHPRDMRPSTASC